MVARAFSPEQDVIVASDYRLGKSMEALAKEYGCSVPAVRNALMREKVELRSAHRPRWRDSDSVFVEDVLRLWHQGRSIEQIKQQLRTTRPIISRVLHAAGLEPHHRTARGNQHGRYKSGRILAQGYVYVLVQPGDPYFSMANATNYIAEHRLIMARHLGRPLLPSETVHHKDGDKTNNKLDNLQLRQGSHGTGVVMVCQDCGSHSIVATDLASHAGLD